MAELVDAGDSKSPDDESCEFESRLGHQMYRVQNGSLARCCFSEAVESARSN